MRNKSVAVLNIRSDEICAVIAEKGVNNTFIIKSKYSQDYEGYAEGEMLDNENFVSALKSALGNLVASCGGSLHKICIGVPCEFTDIIPTDRVVTFPAARKITYRQVEELVGLSRPQVKKGFKIVGCDRLYYYLSDKRKVLNPVGAVSDSLRAKLSFYICNSEFIRLVKEALSSFESFTEYCWVPQNRAEASYLVPKDMRACALMLDFGHISSTFSVVNGNGVAYAEPFSIGCAHMAVVVMEAFNLPYYVAYEFIKTINLNSRDRSSSFTEVNVDGKLFSLRSSELKNVLREGLDGVCETIELCRQSYSGRDITALPIMITGEGVNVIRGSTEHFASRLVVPVEVASPPVPYYDKPSYSSLFSLLSFALDKNLT